ncbi:MAG TPA: hypothetical protein VGC15_07400 [Acetobacteraceae bacterium]
MRTVSADGVTAETTADAGAPDLGPLALADAIRAVLARSRFPGEGRCKV